MPITSTTPIIIDGIEFPFLKVNLSISPLEKTNEIGGSVSLLLTPYRELPEGGFETLYDLAKPVVFLDIFENIQNGDEACAKAVTGILGSIQGFIIDKGL